MTNTHETCLCVIDSEDKFYTLKRQSVLNLRCDDKLPKTFLWNLPKNFLGTKHRHNIGVECLLFHFSSQLTNAKMAKASFGRLQNKIEKTHMFTNKIIANWDRCLQTKIIEHQRGGVHSVWQTYSPILNISTFDIYNLGAPHPEVGIIDRTLVHIKHFCPSFSFFRQQRGNPTKTKLSSCSQIKLLVHG